MGMGCVALGMWLTYTKPLTGLTASQAQYLLTTALRALRVGIGTHCRTRWWMTDAHSATTSEPWTAVWVLAAPVAFRCHNLASDIAHHASSHRIWGTLSNPLTTVLDVPTAPTGADSAASS